jgi:hypothetical protein
MAYPPILGGCKAYYNVVIDYYSYRELWLSIYHGFSGNTRKLWLLSKNIYIKASNKHASAAIGGKQYNI